MWETACSISEHATFGIQRWTRSYWMNHSALWVPLGATFVWWFIPCLHYIWLAQTAPANYRVAPCVSICKLFIIGKPLLNNCTNRLFSCFSLDRFFIFSRTLLPNPICSFCLSVLSEALSVLAQGPHFSPLSSLYCHISPNCREA